LMKAFEDRGYRWAYRVVNSLSFLPQRRERVFIVASKTDLDPATILFGEDAVPKIPDASLCSHAHSFYWTEGTRGLGWAVDAIPTLKNGSTIGIASPPAILLPSGEIIKPDIRDAERLQGFSADWTKPAERVCRPSLRWSLVGNAVSVPVAAWIGNRLNSPHEYGVDEVFEFSHIDKWPKAARFDGKRRFEVRSSGFPRWGGRPPLHEFLQFAGTPLSYRASRGFLERALKSRLRFVPGFLNRVEKHMHRMAVNGDGGEVAEQRQAIAAE